MLSIRLTRSLADQIIFPIFDITNRWDENGSRCGYVSCNDISTWTLRHIAWGRARGARVRRRHRCACAAGTPRKLRIITSCAIKCTRAPALHCGSDNRFDWKLTVHYVCILLFYKKTSLLSSARNRPMFIFKLRKHIVSAAASIIS